MASVEDILYGTNKADLSVYFGDHWCGPEVMPTRREVLIAKYESEEDGYPVKVYAVACSAVFFKISFGSFEISTGSGQHQLTAEIAQALADGMLVVECQ